jgi:hypothetical protein
MNAGGRSAMGANAHSNITTLERALCHTDRDYLLYTEITPCWVKKQNRSDLSGERYG